MLKLNEPSEHSTKAVKPDLCVTCEEHPNNVGNDTGYETTESGCRLVSWKH